MNQESMNRALIRVNPWNPWLKKNNHEFHEFHEKITGFCPQIPQIYADARSLICVNLRNLRIAQSFHDWGNWRIHGANGHHSVTTCG